MSESETTIDLTGKTAVVTGGGGILGPRFVDALAARGARVALVDAVTEKADGAAAEINGKRPDACRPYACDVVDPAAVKALHEKVKKDLGPVDILVNAAAAKSPDFFKGFEEVGAFESFPIEDWNHVMGVNTTGVMICCREIGAAMARRGAGSIVNILSIYGIVAPDQRIYEGSEYEGRAINTPAVYSTSKAAVWGLTRYLATYWGDKGVRVNGVTPGGVFSGQNDTFVVRYSARVPLGRMAEKDEMSGAVVFLASDAASYITGQNIVVDGGLSAW